MRTRKRWRSIVAAAIVAVPLAAVLLSLRYQDGLWPLAVLAGAAAASVALAELGSRSDGARERPADRRRALDESVVSLGSRPARGPAVRD